MTRSSGPQAIHENAWAKLNLALHVTGRRSDGYHLLDSLVVFASTGDEVSACDASDVSLTVLGPMAVGLDSGPDNLVLRAADVLQQYAASIGQNTPGAHIELTKRLPVAAGIGGGSADAAATLRALNKLWKLELEEAVLEQLSAPLGADVPVCISNKTTRITGIGTELSRVADCPTFHLVLVNPSVAVSTPDVFKNLKRRENLHLPSLPTSDDDKSWFQWITATRNDLYPSATVLCPQIDVVLQSLKNTGASLARMSGSGATCFGIFNTAPEAATAAQTIRTAHPQWWVVAAKTV